MPGCEGATLLARSDDPGARGPWPVGVRTVRVGALTVEVWYPAAVGSDGGRPRVVYDARDWLPPSERQKVPDDDAPSQTCECARDLPVDAAHGPYPVVLFFHGTAGFRTQSLSTMTHWASRGFIVLAADHPGLFLGDLVGFICSQPVSGSQDLAGNGNAVLDTLGDAGGPLAFLGDRADRGRVAVAGHSAGGAAVAALARRMGVQLAIPMAAGAAPGAPQQLVLAATADVVSDYARSKSAFMAASGPRRFVGVDRSGHLAFSDLCVLESPMGRTMVEAATAHGVCGVQLAGMLFDCKPEHRDQAEVGRLIAHVTTASLEEVLHCRTPGVSAQQLQGMPGVAEVLEAR